MAPCGYRHLVRESDEGGARYRLIDTAGGEIGISSLDRTGIAEGDTVMLPDGGTATVVEVYDDEVGRDGGVLATLVVEEP